MEKTAQEMQKLFLALEYLIRQYRNYSTDTGKDMDLKAAEILILQTLLYYPQGLYASQICSHMERDKAQISRTIRQLQKKGLIQPNPEDSRKSRKVRFCLTPKGKETSELLLERSEVFCRKMMTEIEGLGVSETDRTA